MAGLNKIMLIGNVGDDPQVNVTQAGGKVATLSLATNRRWKDRDGNQQEATDWHRVKLWDRRAEIAEEYVRKGDRIYIEGRMEYRKYEHQGVERHTAEVVAQRLLLLGGRDGEATAAQRRPPATAPAKAPSAAPAARAGSKPEPKAAPAAAAPPKGRRVYTEEDLPF